MSEAFLITTSSEGLQPLGTAPQRSFELVTGAVRDRLGPAHAALFAEPVATQHGDMIDWYTDWTGKAVPLAELSQEQQATVRDTLGRLIGDIRAEAEKLEPSDAAEDLRLSEALFNALEIPDEKMIQVVRGADGVLHPVLVHWAWVRDEQKAVRGILTGMVPRRVPTPAAGTAAAATLASAAPIPAGQPAANGLWWWLIVLGWIVLAALLGLILYLLIAPCGVNRQGLIFCPTEGAGITAAEAERAVIEDTNAALERELALADRTCQPTIPVVPAVPAVPAPPAFPAPVDETQTQQDREDVDRRISERGAARGDLNFALEWDTVDDVDLYVTCPTGEEISYKNRSACGGTYDLDANVANASLITDPVENVVFEQAPIGIYKVRAHLRGERTQGTKTIVLHVLRRDGPSQSYTGKVGNGQSEWVTNISISR
jgi:hypothetical protein